MRMGLFLLVVVGVVSSEAYAQSEANYTVIGGLSVEYVPASDHALGVRLYGTTPVLIQPRCLASEGTCHGPWPSVAPELGVGWRSDRGLHVDVAIGAGAATAQVYDAGWAPRVQVMPQVGLRTDFTGPLERWIGGYLSKSLAGGWSSRARRASITGTDWGMMSARVGVQIPYVRGAWGPTSVSLGAQMTLRAAVSWGHYATQP